MTLQEKATEMQAESRKIVEQAKANAGKYAKFIKVLTQRKNIGTQQSSFYVELETPYMVIDGRVVEAREEHREAGKILEFEPANFHMSPDGKTQLCSVRVVSQIRGTATGTIEVGTSSPVDRTNPYANAETSALGRALGFLGYGLFGCGIASYEEVDSAMGAEAGKSKGSATANKTADTAGKSAGTDTSGTAGAAGAEGKAPTISAQIKIKTKTALVSAGFTDEEAAAKVNGARTIEDINALLQEAGAKKKATEEAAVNSGVDDKQAPVTDKSKESPAPPESGKTDNAPKDTGAAPSSEGKTSSNGDEAQPISAKEIIGLKKKLKESGKTDDDLAKILPGVKTVGDYRKVIKEYGIAA